MKISFVLLALALACLQETSLDGQTPEAAPTKARGPDLEYTVTLSAADPEQVRVDLLLRDLPAGRESLELELSRGFAFVDLPRPLLSAPPAVHRDDGVLEELEELDPFRFRLATEGAREFLVTIHVPQHHRALPEVRGRDEYEYPYIAKDHGLLVSGTLFLTPDIEPASITVRFDLPAGWRVLTPWNELEPAVFSPGRKEELRDDLIAIGAWSEDRLTKAGFETVIAFAPGQEGLKARAVPRMMRIITEELRLFGRLPRERYLFLFGRPDGRGFGGSPKSGSMTLMISPELPAKMIDAGLNHLIAHEFFHTWMRATAHLPDELRFFNEGFTDYYAYLVPARLELQPSASFYNELALKLAAFEKHATQSGLSLAEAGGDVFFQGGAAYHHVYAGGAVLAFLLDLHVRRSHEGADLDVLMRTFVNDERWLADDVSPTLEDFLVLVEKVIGEEEGQRFRDLVTSPGAPDLVAEFARAGVELQREERAARLVLRANLRDQVVLDIDPDGPAFGLGIRAGDQLIQVNGVEPGNEDQLRKAWRTPTEEGLHVVVERGGERVELSGPVPRETVFQIPTDALQGGF